MLILGVEAAPAGRGDAQAGVKFLQERIGRDVELGREA